MWLSQKYCTYLDSDIFLIDMSGSYTIYINGEGECPRSCLLQNSDTTFEHRATGSLHFTAYVWSSESNDPQSQTRSQTVLPHPIFRHDGTRCQTLILHQRLGASSTPLLFLYDYGMTEKPIALLLHCLCPIYMCVFYCNDHAVGLEYYFFFFFLPLQL